MNKALTGLAGLVTGAFVALAPMKNEAASTLWGNIGSTSAGTTLSVSAANNDAGTSYNQININSAIELVNRLYLINNDRYSSISEMLSATDGNGQRLVRFGINDSSEVYNGWTGNLNLDGSINVTQGTGRGVDSMNEGQTLLGYIFVDSELYDFLPQGADFFELTQNTQGLTDSANYGDVQFSTQPGYIPVPEPTSMALIALGVAALGLRRPKYINKEDVKVGPAPYNI